MCARTIRVWCGRRSRSLLLLLGVDSRTHVPAGHLVLLQSLISVSRLLTDDRRRFLHWLNSGQIRIPLRKSYLNSLDFVVNRFFMKMFQTSNIDIVKCCQSHFCFDLPSVVHDRRARKFDPRYKDHSNPFCRMISHLWMLWVWYFPFLFRYCRYCRALYLYLVKFLFLLSDVLFFFFLLLCYQLWWIKMNIYESSASCFLLVVYFTEVLHWQVREDTVGLRASSDVINQIKSNQIY